MLTDAQVRVLRALREGEELWCFPGELGVMPPSCSTPTLSVGVEDREALMPLLAFVEGYANYYRRYTIAPAGLAALAQHEANLIRSNSTVLKAPA